jgi:acetyl-CoA synthetase
MMKSSGAADRYRHAVRKLSFTGEPMDTATRAFVEETFRVPVCSMYGTTEVGVILADYPGAADYTVKPGALGRPVPGVRVEVQRPDGERCAPDELGEIVVWRRGAWFPTKDRGWVDADGYFYHAGRADDAIISAGWTMSAVEIEDVLLKHTDVRDAAVIGVADALRGLVVKAFIVSPRPGDDAFARELQELVRTRLSQHEYPRHVAFVPDLPKTPAGKINRKALRDSETVTPASGEVEPTHAP